MRLEKAGSRRLALLIPGMVLIMLSLLVLASGGAKAQATGDWSSNGSGEGFVLDCWASTFHYDVEMTLNSDHGGSITTICRSVTDVQPGWEEAYDNIGNSQTQGLTWSSSGSSVTFNVDAVSCEATVSGNSMTGSGSYYDPGSGITYYYDIALTREGGGGGGGGGGGDIDMGGLTVPAAGAAVAAGAIGVGASLGGTGPVSASYWGPDLVRPPAPTPPPPPAVNPAIALSMPVPPTDPNTGSHLVPADAPIQEPYNSQPNNNATRQCRFCHQMTLSPLSSGWRCTNAACPGRQQIHTHGYTTHEFHHEAWRGQENMQRFEGTNVQPTEVKLTNIETWRK